MKSILIKPHHFIDVIKLYGSGIEKFVPDENMGHDFYKIANEIINHPSMLLRLTKWGDDICKPCKQYEHKCMDAIVHIPGYKSKDDYNISLDEKIMGLYHLDKENYSALELCAIILERKEKIFEVWCEENIEITERRYELFSKGAKKFLGR